jgi:hypothetical protein
MRQCVHSLPHIIACCRPQSAATAAAAAQQSAHGSARTAATSSVFNALILHLLLLLLLPLPLPYSAAAEGCLVTTFAELRDALENAPTYKSGACVDSTGKKAVIKLKCADATFSRGNGTIVAGHSAITDWELTTGCASASNGMNKLKAITIDFNNNPELESKKVNVLKFETATGASLKMTNLNFVFKNAGECSDTGNCAIISIAGFKTVSITKVSMNMGGTSVLKENLPASGILIKNADTITLDKVLIAKMKDNGIKVQGGGAISTTGVKVGQCGGHGLLYGGCHERPLVLAAISLKGPVSSFNNNGGSGLGNMMMMMMVARASRSAASLRLLMSPLPCSSVLTR